MGSSEGESDSKNDMNNSDSPLDDEMEGKVLDDSLTNGMDHIPAPEADCTECEKVVSVVEDVKEKQKEVSVIEDVKEKQKDAKTSDSEISNINLRIVMPGASQPTEVTVRTCS